MGIADKVFSLSLVVLVAGGVAVLIGEDVILLSVTLAVDKVYFVKVEATPIGEDAIIILFEVVAVLTTTDVGEGMLV